MLLTEIAPSGPCSPRIGAAWHAKDWYVDHLRSTETAVFESLAETQQNIQATEQMLWSMEQAPRGRRNRLGFEQEYAAGPFYAQFGPLFEYIILNRASRSLLDAGYWMFGTRCRNDYRSRIEQPLGIVDCRPGAGCPASNIQNRAPDVRNAC
jgi:hypothetical protein